MAALTSRPASLLRGSMVAMCSPWRSWGAVVAAVVSLFAAAPAAGAEPRGPVYVVEMSGAIGVASSTYLERTLRHAAADDARLVVLRLDTPGGLVGSTRT